MRARTLKPTSPDRANQRNPSRLSTALPVIGIVLLAANLRPAITAVGPLIEEIRADIGISNGLIGLLTALPLLAFAALSPLAPRLARRWGMEFTLLVSLIALTAGIVLRSLPSVAALFTGTALLGTAIAISNVLLPSLMKRDFPTRVGLMTSVYPTIMGSWAALAAGVSVPIAQGLSIGWPGSLACWAMLAVVAIVVWLPQLRSHRAIASERTRTTVRGVCRSPLAWQVTLFMGFQSLVFYAVVTWLSAILRDQGMSATSAGWIVSLFQVVGIPSTFLVPMLAGRRPSQRVLVVAAGILCLTAYAGLLSTSNTLIPRVDHSARARPGSMYKPDADVLYPTYTRCSSRRRIVGHGPVHWLSPRSSRSCTIRALTRSDTYLDYSPINTRSSHSSAAFLKSGNKRDGDDGEGTWEVVPQIHGLAPWLS